MLLAPAGLVLHWLHVWLPKTAVPAQDCCPLHLPCRAAGDSRCVLSKRGQARALTLDHKPILFEEAKRIIKVRG